MFVYLVRDTEDLCIEGIFSTEEQAEQFLQSLEDKEFFGITAFEVDVPEEDHEFLE